MALPGKERSECRNPVASISNDQSLAYCTSDASADKGAMPRDTLSALCMSRRHCSIAGSIDPFGAPADAVVAPPAAVIARMMAMTNNETLSARIGRVIALSLMKSSLSGLQYVGVCADVAVPVRCPVGVLQVHVHTAR
jgi:hypothetical protein